MLKLGKKPAIRIRDLCREYYEAEKELGYYKFCKEQSFISKRFWSVAIKDVKFQASLQELIKKPEESPEPLAEDFKKKPEEPIIEKLPEPSDNFRSLLPVSWIKMSRADRIEFIKKIQHEGFRSYVLELDPSLKNYFSLIRNKSEKMKLYVTLFQIPASCSEEAKSILKCFVENLNSFGRASLQFVECKEPNVIEIREMK
jgi:hypothetical protein